MIRVFGYLAWRSAVNRLSRQLAQLRNPRYLAALVFGLAYIWIVAIEQRPQTSTPALVGARWVEVLGALGVVGAVLWGWVFGVDVWGRCSIATIQMYASPNTRAAR